MSITNERLRELARTADLDPFEVRALIAEVLALREQRDKAWPGVITTATFSRGDVYRDADCDVECECVCHDEPPLPEGTYVTVKLDRDESIGLRRVRVLDDGPRALGVTEEAER